MEGTDKMPFACNRANLLSAAVIMASIGAGGLASCAGPSAKTEDHEQAELIFTNAHVYTVDDEQPWARAVAVDGGRIVAVGTQKEVGEYEGDGTRVIDLSGRLLMPAFGDAHVHPVFGGMAHTRCSLHEGESLEDYQEIIAGCIAEKPADEPVYGVGWRDSLFPPNGIPRKEVLDEVSTERALIFESIGGHSYWVNSKTLDLAGIDKETPDPPNGHINRDAETGEPAGGLQESAMGLVSEFVAEPGPDEIEASILYVAREFNRLGITNWHDAGIDLAADGTSQTLAAYKAVMDRGDLTSHVSLAFRWSNGASLEQIPNILGAVEQAKTWGINARAVKFYEDGVIPQRTAAMIEPYAGGTSLRGQLQIAPDVLKKAVSELGASGVQPHVHAIGDRATRVALDAFEAVKDANGTAHRPMISHLNVVSPSDQARFGPLGAIAVFQPTWSANYLYMDLTKKALGPERSKYIYPAGSILEGGGILAYGADWPVATADPLLGIEVAITRVNYEQPDSDPLLPNEAVSLEEAVKAHTLNVAYANRNEDVTGSVAVGKSADLIVLDRNIFDLAPQEISEASVILTLFEGEAVHGDLDQFSETIAE